MTKEKLCIMSAMAYTRHMHHLEVHVERFMTKDELWYKVTLKNDKKRHETNFIYLEEAMEYANVAMTAHTKNWDIERILNMKLDE